jgi:hypothetical protein
MVMQMTFLGRSWLEREVRGQELAWTADGSKPSHSFHSWIALGTL